MKYLFFTLFSFASNIYALDADAIRTIAGEAHNRKNLIDELKLFPHAREYKITIHSGPTKDRLEASPEIVATEKTVRGHYIVSEVNFPEVENPLIMVVTYDKEIDAFNKWVLFPNGIVGASTGVADLKKRTIAWISNEAHGQPPTIVLSIESNSDDKSTWKETTLQDGKVIALSYGVAVKTK